MTYPPATAERTVIRLQGQLEALLATLDEIAHAATTGTPIPADMLTRVATAQRTAYEAAITAHTEATTP